MGMGALTTGFLAGGILLIGCAAGMAVSCRRYSKTRKRIAKQAAILRKENEILQELIETIKIK